MDTKRLLEKLGYEFVFRDGGIIEVLVYRGAERWIGRGFDRTGALEDAVHQMFPSFAAQEAMAALLDGEAPVRAGDGAPVEVEPPPEAAAGGPAGAANDVVAEPPEQPTADRTEPASTGSEHVSSKSDLQVGDVIDLPGRAPDDGVVEVEGILGEINDAEEEIALMSPRMIQVHLLAWICRAREQQTTFPGDNRVRRTVSTIARQLGGLSNKYWPGPVPALRSDAHPSATARALGLHEPPASWLEAADAADSIVGALLEDEDLDEDGWRDRGSLTPGPGDPDRLLRQLLDRVASLAGPLDARKDKRLEAKLESLDAGGIERLVEAAKLARWLRGSQVDATSWGALMGHLRWAGYKLGARGAELSRFLDPEYRPPQPWSMFMARQDAQAERIRERARLSKGRPWLGASEVEQQPLLDWLLDAFSVFNTEEVAALVSDASGAVRALDESGLDLTRGQRRRLRALQDQLSGEGTRVEVVVEEPDESDLFGESNSVLQPDPGQALIDAVAPLVQGKHALFVSNRDDAALRDRLESVFGFTLDWCVADPRKIQAAAKRIARGGYDLVIAATGFMSHKDDRALAGACEPSSVPYVRAYRGRTQATAKALARTFGVTA